MLKTSDFKKRAYIKMNFSTFRRTLRSSFIKPGKFILFVSLALIVLAWPLPILFDHSQLALFGIPLTYFYIVLVGPALILYVTNWAVKFADRQDQNQLETEND